MSHLPPEIDWGNPNPVPQPVIAPTGIGAARPVWLCITSPEYTSFSEPENCDERGKTNIISPRPPRPLPDGVPVGYTTACLSRCGLSYTTIIKISNQGKIPSVLVKNKRYIDEAAATEYALQSKKLGGKLNG